VSGINDILDKEIVKTEPSGALESHSILQIYDKRRLERIAKEETLLFNITLAFC
jgi:hypothetical protein